MADRTVSVKLVADVGGYVGGVSKASAATKGLGSDFDKVSTQSGRSFSAISQGAGALTGSLKMAGAALGGLAVVDFFRDSIGAASDLNETLNKSNVIFGANAQKVEKWATGAAENFGLSKQAALEAASGFGNMLTQLGYTGDEATNASQDVVKLAADLGSFNNLETGDVLDRIGAAMRGEYDSLQLLVPNINAARVETEALAMSGKKNKDELTAQEKAAAVLAIVNKDGAAAANDFAETQDGLANKTKIAAAQFEDLKSKVGQAFLPVAQETMGFLSSTAIPALEGVFDTVMDLVGVFGDLPGPVQVAIGAFGLWMVAGDQIKGVLSGISGGLTPMKDTMRAFGDALDYARANGDGFTTVLRSAGDYAGGQALTAFKNLARAIGPELGIAAGVFAIGQIIEGFQLLTGASDDAKAAAEGLADALTLTDEVADRRSIRRAIEDTDGLAKALEQAGISSADAIDGLLGQKDATDRVTSALQAYINLRPGGIHNEEATGALQAKHAYEELATGYGTAAGNARYFADSASGSADATADTQGAAETAAPAVDDLATQLEGAATAADDAKKRTDAFKLSLDILTGAHVSMIEVESAFQASLAEATGAMEGLDGKVMDTNGNLNLQSEAGRKASDVLLGVRDSGNELIAQMISQGATTDEVKAKDAQLRDSFIKSAQQMGISKDAAYHLADQILGIPSERETTITADTKQATDAAAAVQAAIDNLKGRTLTISLATMQTGNGTFQQSFQTADGGRALSAKYQARGGILGDSMSAGVAEVVPPNTWRVIGDRMVDDEAYIPINGSSRSRSILEQTAARMGYGLTDNSRYLADGGLLSVQLGLDESAALAGMASYAMAAANKAATPSAGSGGGMTGTWSSIWGIVKAAIPQARINSTYRPGDPGYHGRNKAIDFGFGSGPGGAGSAGLASIAAFLYRGYGRSLAELIYDGIGDNTPDVKNGADHVYNPGTRADHENHVHAAVYHQGTDYVPQTGWAYLEKGEAVIPASINSREFSGFGFMGGAGSNSASSRSVEINVTGLDNADLIAAKVAEAQRTLEFLHG